MTAPTRTRTRRATPAKPAPAGRARSSSPRPGTPQDPAPGLRLLAVLLVILVAAAGLVYRLVDLQLADSSNSLVQYGLNQRTRTIELAGGRGDIVDRNHNTLATSLPAQSFFVDPEFVVDPLTDGARLAPVIGRPVAEVQELMASGGRFHWLTRHTSDAKAAEILALDIPGVFSTEEATRFHPSGSELARASIGNVDIDGKGLSGVELIHDELLTGRPGELSVEIGVHGEWIPGAPELVRPAAPGSDIVLTLDRSLQFEVERILAAQVESMGARGGVVMVTEPDTGEVLALANVTRNEADQVVSTSLNMATSWAYEPGSIMKAMTFSAVLDSGVGNLTTQIEVPDTRTIYDAEFTDSTPHAPAWWTIPDIVTVSSNVGTIHWAEQLGGERLDQYLRRFGFGRSSQQGFPGETPGVLIAPDRWGGVATATTALGQGILVTPWQMAAAYNTIANNGVYRPLTMIREYVADDGVREVPAPGPEHRVISPETAIRVRAMLENAVSVGTGVNAAVDGYRVAGKTGTARKVLDDGTGYEDGAGNYRYVASFVGMLPADQPELSILVTIDQPTATIYAGQAAAPAFADIATFAVRHLRIAPPAPSGVLATAVHVPQRLEDRLVGQVAVVATPEPLAEPDPGAAQAGEGVSASGPDTEPETGTEPEAARSRSDALPDLDTGATGAAGFGQNGVVGTGAGDGQG